MESWLAFRTLLQLSVLLLGNLRPCLALTFTLNNVECFGYDVSKDNEWVFASFAATTFNHWNSNPALVDLKVLDPYGSPAHQGPPKPQDQDDFAFFAYVGGEYKFCFENKGSAAVTVSLDIRGAHHPSRVSAAQADQVEQVQGELSRLVMEVQHMHHEAWHTFYLAKTHFNVDLQVDFRILLRAVMQGLMLVLCAAGQVYLLRLLVEKPVQRHNRV